MHPSTTIARYSRTTEVITHVELRRNRDGQDRAYLVGTRVRVQDIYAYSEIQGLSADEIVAQLPHLTLGQVHAALSYYFDHREQILGELRDDDQFVRAMRERTGPGPMRQFLDGLSANDAVSS